MEPISRQRETSSIKKAFKSFIIQKNSNHHSRASSQISTSSHCKDKKPWNAWMSSIKERMAGRKETKNNQIPQIRIETSPSIHLSNLESIDSDIDQNDSLEPIIIQKKISIKRESSQKEFKARFGRFVFNEIHPKQSKQKSQQEIMILKPSYMSEEDILSSSNTLRVPDKHLHSTSTSSFSNFFSSSQSSFLNLFNSSNQKRVSPNLSRKNLFTRSSNSTLQLSTTEDKKKPKIQVNQIIYKLQQDPIIKNKIIQSMEIKSEKSIKSKPTLPKRYLKNLPLPTLNVDPLYKISTSTTDLFELERQLEVQKLTRQRSKMLRSRTNQVLPQRARELSLWNWFGVQKHTVPNSSSSATLIPSRRPSLDFKTHSVIELQNIP